MNDEPSPTWDHRWPLDNPNPQHSMRHVGTSATECQFADRPHLTHRPFSERAPICWDCFNAVMENAEGIRERLEALLSEATAAYEATRRELAARTDAEDGYEQVECHEAIPLNALGRHSRDCQCGGSGFVYRHRSKEVTDG